MKIIFFIVTKIFALISIVLLVWAFMNLPERLFLLFLLNSLAVLSIYLINRYFLKREFYLPIYLALILPGPGTLILSLMDVFEKNNRNSAWRIREYQKYLEAIVDSGVAKAAEELNLEKESNILSASDELKFSDQLRKKEMLINIGTEDESQYMISILKKAIYDTDTEIKHYASTFLVAIEDKFEKAIAAYKRAYETERSTKNALALIQEYERYISYGILDEITKKSIMSDMLGVLLEAKNLMLDDLEIEIKLMNVYNELNLYEKSDEILEEIELLYSGDEKVLLSAMRLNFKKRDYSKVAEYARRIKALNSAPDEERDKLTDYWISA
jgi:tetratricopeptide (TPR) repeat protein